MDWRKRRSSFSVFFVTFAVLCVFLFYCVKPAKAQPLPVSVFVNGQQIFFPDVEPVIVQGRTLVPIRFIVESPFFNATISYNSTTRQIAIQKGDIQILLWPYSRNVIVNGVTRNLDVAPIIKQGRTLVPLRFLIEALGATVIWDGAARRVLITVPPQNKIVLGYYYGGSYDEFLAQYTNLTDVAFHWYEADENGNIVENTPDSYRTVLDLAAQNDIKTHASISLFDRDKLHTLFNSKNARLLFISNVINLVRREGYQAVNLDFEFIRLEDKDAFNSFLAELSDALKNAQIELFAAVPAKDKDVSWYAAYDYSKIGKYVDRVVLMTYDYHYRTGSPGPVAPYDWVSRVIKYARQFLPPEKIILGLGIYGYDWPATGIASTVTCEKAEALAASLQVKPAWDSVARLPHYNYVDEAGVSHAVWYENGVSLQAKLDLAVNQGLAGVSIWRLGFGFSDFWTKIAAFRS